MEGSGTSSSLNLLDLLSSQNRLMDFVVEILWQGKPFLYIYSYIVAVERLWQQPDAN